MIERIVEDDDQWPDVTWTISILPTCRKCGKAMTLVEGSDPARIECKSGHAVTLSQSPDDVADALTARTRVNKHMNVNKIIEQAKIETEVEKKEAKEGD